LSPRAPVRRALHILAAARLAEKLSVVHNNFPARNHRAGVAADFKAFEHRVVHAHVVRAGAESVHRLGIPNYHVGVTTHGDFALTRVHAKNARGCSGPTVSYI